MVFESTNMRYETLVARFWLRVRGVPQSSCRRQSRDKRQELWGRECRCLLILATTRGLYSWPLVNFYEHQETEGAHYLIDFAIWTNSFILTK